MAAAMAVPGLNPFAPVMAAITSTKDTAMNTCTGGHIDEEEDVLPEAEAVEVPPDQLVTYWLRMCIYSAHDLPSGDPYCQIELGDDNIVSTTPTQKDTEAPVWEHSFETKFDVEGKTPPLILKVYDHNILSDKLLGTVTIKLPMTPTPGAKRQKLRLKNVPAQMCSAPKKSTITVTWQVCDSNEKQPDLLQISELNAEDLEMKEYTMTIELKKLKLRKPLKKPQPTPAIGRFQLYNAATGVRQELKISSEAMIGGLRRQHEQMIEARWRDENDPDQGWITSWSLRESKATLLSYFLSAEVHTLGAAAGETHQLGAFSEALSNLQDAIEQNVKKYHCWCVLHNNVGAVAGRMYLEIDIFANSEGPHADPVVDNVESLPKLRGEMLPEERDKKVEYFVWCYGDYFPKLGGDRIDPYIKVSMGHHSADSEVQTDALRRVEWKASPIRVVTTGGIRKAKVELWNDNTMFFFGSDELVGESTIYDVQPNKNYWIHLYGGVLNPPADRADECFAMTKGAISPPSTYRGSLCLHFGVKNNINKSHWKRIQESYAKRTLTVRLYKGLYLRALAGARVNILVQVPSGEVPTRHKPPKAGEGGCCSCACPSCSKCCAGEKDLTAEKRALINQLGSNRDILSFPGYVDHEGILRFYASKTAKEAKKAGSDSGGGLCCGSGVQTRNLWVERSTPFQFPLEVLPNVTHAFIYLQIQGEELLPPRIFGKIRLGGHPTIPHKPADKAAKDLRPGWRRLRWDASVTPPPPAHFQRAMAGWILGSAHMDLVDEGDPMLTDMEAETAQEDEYTPSATEPPRPSIRHQPPAHDEGAINEKLHFADPKPGFCASTKPREGFLGTQVRYMAEPGSAEDGAKATQSVYLHVDVLAAQNLPALDEDGLCDPGYNIRCDSVMVDGMEDLPKSLNPTLMHRACIKIETHISEKKSGVGEEDDEASKINTEHNLLPEELDIPLPPVMFNMYEIDKDLTGLVTKNMIGTVVCKRPRNLDQANEDSDGTLDVNFKHQAVWYLLDGSGYAPFDPTKEGGIKPSWRPKSRVLLSIGYSLQSGELGETDGFRPLQTGNLQSYDFIIDLLGLRNLRLPPPGIGTIYRPAFSIISYFERPIEVDVVDEELPNPNFKGELPPKEDWQPIAETVKKVVNIVEATDEDEEAPQDDGEDDPNKPPPVEKVGLDEFVGIRLELPRFRAQIIPYLQTKTWTGVKQGKGDNSVVLLPDVSFKLVNNMGLGEIGSLSMPLGPYEVLQRERGNAGDRWEKMKAETKNLSDTFKNLYPVHNVLTKDEYDVFIDIVAPATGNLTFDTSLRMGRSVQESHLLDIDTDEPWVPSWPPPEGEILDSVPVYFNDDDFMFNNDMFLDDPFDHRVMPHFKVDRLNEAPLPTEELFEAYETITSEKKLPLPRAKAKGKGKAKAKAVPEGPKALRPEALTTAGEHKTHMKRVKEVLESNGFRCTSHLYSPGLVKPEDPKAPPEVKEKVKDSLKQNFRTYMRSVGHQIMHKHDPRGRNSRYLAKLRMYTRDDNDKDLSMHDPRTVPTPNFVVIKFNKPGTIVWAAPEHIDTFDSVGDLLFIVELADDDKTKVRVTVPNMDLRFPFETAYYLRKNCAVRWMTLQKMIEGQEAARKAAAEKAKKKKTKAKAKPKADAKSGGDKNAAGASEQETDEDEEDEGAEDEEGGNDDDKKKRKKPMPPPDGYSRPIPVVEGEFLVRLLRRKGCVHFDREQTDNWYASCLGQVFPDILERFDEGKDAVKEEFQERCLNLRKFLTAGESSVKTGLIKGHVTIKRVDEAKESPQEKQRKSKRTSALMISPVMSMSMPGLSMPGMSMPGMSMPNIAFADDKPPTYTPLEHFWQVDTVNVHIYVLTARQLKFSAIDKADPYVQVAIEGGPKGLFDKEVSCANDANPDFYQHFTVTATLPGASTLKIRVMDKGLLSDTLVGECAVDLEDRWMAISQCKMRELSEAKHLERYTSPNDVKTVADAEGKEKHFQPLLAPPAPMPLESRHLVCVDEETGEENETGVVRFWIDMVSSDAEYIDATFTTAYIDFEVRLTCWDVSGISIWADMGQRNDLYVKGCLLTKGIKGNSTRRDFETDIHKFAHDRATFNWRWVLDVKMPVIAAALMFRLCDSDTMTGDDPIYDPKVQPLDHQLMLAYRLEVSGQKPLGTATRKIVFDTWAEDKSTSKVGCCGSILGDLPPTPAVMTLDIQILPKHMATSSPVGEGREGPSPLPPPGERMEWATALSEPVRFTKVMLGPVNWSRCTALCTCLLITILLGTVLALLFFASQTFATM